jgi:GWxTD domain-containing protein
MGRVAVLIAAALAASVATGGLAGQQAGEGLQLRAIRFWAPTAAITDALVMVNVPYALATPTGIGADAHIAYDVTVKVTDDKGLVLATQQWPRRAAAALRQPGATGMEQLELPLKPGRYTLTVSVKDSVSGRTTTDSLRLDGYASEPAASDLLVATSMRLAPPNDTTSYPGEMSRGAYRFYSSPVVHIDITRPNLAFLMEAYSPDATRTDLRLSLKTTDGKQFYTFPPQQKDIPAGGGNVSGVLPLEGLPAGQYVLSAQMTLAGRTVEREAPFMVSEAEAALQRTIASNEAASGIDSIYFQSLPEDSLDADAEVLQIYPGVKKSELSVYDKESLTLGAKRKFLIEFWSQRDADKRTPVNEERIRFYQQVGYANAHYGEQGRLGWKTDRGRVFAKFGTPTDSLDRPIDGKAPPYLVWKYTRGKLRWFIFTDRSNNGNYTLLTTNETTELRAPANLVVETMTPEVLRDVAIWLGLQPNYFTQNLNFGVGADTTFIRE